MLTKRLKYELTEQKTLTDISVRELLQPYPLLATLDHMELLPDKWPTWAQEDLDEDEDEEYCEDKDRGLERTAL